MIRNKEIIASCAFGSENFYSRDRHHGLSGHNSSDDYQDDGYNHHNSHNGNDSHEGSDGYDSPNGHNGPDDRS